MKKINNILIVDDDAIHNFICKRIIQKMEFCEAFHIEGNGEQGLEYIKNSQLNNLPLPEAILVDIHMPVMGGVDFIEQLKELKISDYHPFIVLMSASSEQTEERHNSESHHFIQKPFMESHFQEIYEAVSNKANA